MTTLDAALDRLERGLELPREPDAQHFVAWSDPGLILREQRALIVPELAWHRAMIQRRRIQQRINGSLCASAPRDCRECGAPFYRDRVNVVRCPNCRAARRGA